MRQPPRPSSDASGARAGAVFAASAFLLWGLSPLYWRLLLPVPALELVAHRVVWALVMVAAWITVKHRWGEVRGVVGSARTMAALAASTVLIAVNWLTYVWAVNSGHVLDASLGYYINPLVSVMLGLAVLRERLSRRQGVAVLLAATGVVVLSAGHGSLPWISLVLAFSFGLYGLLRKTVRAAAAVGLLFETAVLTPFAAGLLALLAARGGGAFGHASPGTDLLLVASGLITAVPLILFTEGARRLPLSTLGLLQYLSPTAQFLLAVLVYRERFTAVDAVTFVLIWSALAVFTADLRIRLREARAVTAAARAMHDHASAPCTGPPSR